MSTDPVVVLDADSLFSRYGFGDGDILTDALDNAGLSIENEKETLRWLVRHTLLPVIPFEVKVEDVITLHNPIQAVEECEHLASQVEALGISVTIPLSIIPAISEALLNGQNPEQYLRGRISSPQTHLIGTEPTLGSVSHEDQISSSTDSS